MLLKTKITLLTTSLCCVISSIVTNAQTYTFDRFDVNPIITPAMLGEDGENINGPSLIKVPNWVTGRLGKYYLYFAHHQGQYIRLAYVDDLKGPWKIYKGGVLKTTDCRCGEAAGKPETSNASDVYLSNAHIASPDVHIDEAGKQIVMYFHCPLNNNGKKGQYSLRSVSKNGLQFLSEDVVLGESYFRVIQWKDAHYAIARAGELYKSVDGGKTFEHGGNPFAHLQTKENYVRHVALKIVKDELLVFHTRIGDKPESILVSSIKLSPNWKEWKASPAVLIAQPEKEYEGAHLPLTVSKMGSYHGLIRELRDPGFYEENGKWYLLYSVGGEHGLGIAEIKAKK
jgi:hypothetical protein